MLIKFEMGDPSNDGHGQCEVVNIESNKTVAEITKAHNLATISIGFDITEYCSDYEDSKLPDNCLNYLELAEYDDVERIRSNGNWIDTDTFFDIYMFFVKEGFKLTSVEDFEYKIIRTNNVIDIGGYGLFSS